MAASYGAIYSQGAAGDAGAGLLSPADSFVYGEASWPDTPYVLSPRLDNDDDDVLADFPQVNFFGLDPHIPLANQTVFPPAGTYVEPSTQSSTFAGGIELLPGFTHSEYPSQNWDFGGASISDRLFQTSVHPPAPPLLFEPIQPSTAGTPKVLDLRFARLHTAPGQDLTQEKSDLIVKVQEGCNIQPISADNATDGVETLRQCLSACQVPGQRGLSAQEIQRLLVKGLQGDPATAKGHIVERLTPEHLQTALNRYGLQKGTSYKLGIVRSTQSTLDFELLMLPNPPSMVGQIIIWVYQELVNLNPSTGFYEYSRWAAITPSTMPAKNYAQALQSPTPKAKEVQKPVDPQFLHVGRRSTVSSQTGTVSGSSSSSVPTKCCGKVWTSKASYKNHEKSHARPDDRPFKCDQCGRGFLWQKDLNRHMPRHNGNKDYVCPMLRCGKTYTRRDNMVRHHDDAHPEQSPLSTKSRGSSASENNRHRPYH